MKISAIASWLFAVVCQKKVPSIGPPYFPRSFGTLGNQPASRKVAEARLSELEGLLTGIESDIVKEMQVRPEDVEGSYARIKSLQRTLVDDLREYVYIKKWLDDYLEWHFARPRFQSKEDALLVLSRELTRDRISYVRLHTEKYPPDSIEAAEDRIAFLNEQEYILEETLDDIAIEGHRQECKDSQIHRVQRHVHEIKRVILHERRVLKDWVTREHLAARIRQDASASSDGPVGDGSTPAPA